MGNPRRLKRRIRPTEIIFGFLKYSSLILVAFITLLPLYAVVITAFKTVDEFRSTNVMQLPAQLNWESFTRAWEFADMGRGMVITAFVTVVVLLVSVLTGSQMAFVLSRFKFPGNNLIRNLFLFASLIPSIAMQVPLYLIMAKLGLINSLGGYILLQCGVDVISVYIYIQFFQNLDVALDEAALIDGANYFRIFYQVLLPLLKPAIVTCCILKGVAVYKEYYTANLYLQDKEKFVTMATSLYKFVGPYSGDYNYICAGVIIVLIPVLIIFLACQKQIYAGLAAGSVKG